MKHLDSPLGLMGAYALGQNKIAEIGDLSDLASYLPPFSMPLFSNEVQADQVLVKRNCCKLRLTMEFSQSGRFGNEPVTNQRIRSSGTRKTYRRAIRVFRPE